MFKELAPMLAKRSLIITITSVGDDLIRATVTPRVANKDEAKELSQPFVVEGTAIELDAELAAAIVGYTTEHLTLERSLAQVKANMEAALKEAKDEAARKVAESKKSAKGPVVAKTDAGKPEVKKTAPPPSLFGPEPDDELGVPSDSPSDAREVETNGDDDVQDEAEGESSEKKTTSSSSSSLSLAMPIRAGATPSPINLFSSHDEEDELLKEIYASEDTAVAA